MPKPTENWEKDKVDSLISIMEADGFRCRIVEGDSDYSWFIEFKKTKDGVGECALATLGVVFESALLASVLKRGFERISPRPSPKPVPLMDAVR